MNIDMAAVILAIGAFDAVSVLVLGVVGAVLYIWQPKNSEWIDRIFPAAAILVSTSFGAGVLVAITRWLASLGI